ncbi:UNVERIFIED_CONTAM: hypothetical protein Scaly_2931500 [Sesamum calycinum]|uniref:Reverse transcriptase domain-containing protein n=1 Tax=Sesamum calycinum TaxID=2727403 RepID=A0AAW2KXH1_9LAMI
MYFQTKCEIKISHLSYADDVIIFTNCKETGLIRLMNFLRKFEEQSGQQINQAKSAFIQGRKANLIANRIKNITGFSMKALPITYLGAPLYKGNKRKVVYEKTESLVGKTTTFLMEGSPSTPTNLTAYTGNCQKMERSRRNPPGNAICNHQQSQPIYRSLWSKLIIPNIFVFAWRLIHNWVPVDERLKKKGITLEPLGTNTNTQAELSAIHRGLQICRDKGSRKIWIETDAKEIIMLISSPRQGAWNLQNSLQRIRNILSQMTYRISHIFREGNQAAYFLDNQACLEQQLCIFQEDGLIAISTHRRRRQWYSLSYYSFNTASISWKRKCHRAEKVVGIDDSSVVAFGHTGASQPTPLLISIFVRE